MCLSFLRLITPKASIFHVSAVFFWSNFWILGGILWIWSKNCSVFVHFFISNYIYIYIVYCTEFESISTVLGGSTPRSLSSAQRYLEIVVGLNMGWLGLILSDSLFLCFSYLCIVLRWDSLDANCQSSWLFHCTSGHPILCSKLVRALNVIEFAVFNMFFGTSKSAIPNSIRIALQISTVNVPCFMSRLGQMFHAPAPRCRPGQPLQE